VNRLDMYRLLGVEGNATIEEIKHAYRKLAKQYHPDLTKDGRDAEHFADIVNAYKTLVVATKRRSLIDFPVRETRRTGTAAASFAKSSFYTSTDPKNTHTKQGFRGAPFSGRTPAGSEERGINVFALGKLLTEGKNPATRIFAARSLANAAKRSAYPFLRKALYDTDSLVVKSAVEAIGALRIQQCAGELGSVFMRGNKEIKQATLSAIERIGVRGEFRNILTVAMKDGDPDIRKLSLKLYSTAV